MQRVANAADPVIDCVGPEKIPVQRHTHSIMAGGRRTGALRAISVTDSDIHRLIGEVVFKANWASWASCDRTTGTKNECSKRNATSQASTVMLLRCVKFLSAASCCLDINLSFWRKSIGRGLVIAG